jgi:diguanylate cyclase (GGDEF)-like protein
MGPSPPDPSGPLLTAPYGAIQHRQIVLDDVPNGPIRSERAYHPLPPASLGSPRVAGHSVGDATMTISPNTLFVIAVATTIASILILAAASVWTRGIRTRRLAAVEGMLASSYLDAGSGGAWPGSSVPVSAEAVGDVADPTNASPGVPEQRSLDFENDAGAADLTTGSIEATTDDADGPTAEADVPPPVAPGRAIVPPRGRDALTGLLDPLAFEDVLTHEEAREERYRRSTTVIIFELDGLARLVDRLGPDAGDRIEPAVADTISRLARRADYVARLEPGRYAALLPETDEIAAINYVERIRRACDLWLESGAMAMRLAIGWASTSGDASLASVMRTATERMRVELRRRNGRMVGDAPDMAADEERTGL